jgi:hypothetical protein
MMLCHVSTDSSHKTRQNRAVQSSHGLNTDNCSKFYLLIYYAYAKVMSLQGITKSYNVYATASAAVVAASSCAKYATSFL